MSLDAAALRRLASLNLSPEQMAGVLDVLASMTEQEEARKAAQRERTRKFREKIGVTLQSPHGNGDKSRAGDARVEVKTSNLDNNTEEKKETARGAVAGDLQEFRSALSPLVDAERLESYVKHRKAKRGQLTGHAARLFLADAAACSMSPAEAVDACISRNWITVKPEYFAGRSRAPPPLQKPETTRDVGTRLLAEMRSANGQPGTSDSRHQRALVAIPGGRDAGTG